MSQTARLSLRILTAGALLGGLAFAFRDVDLRRAMSLVLGLGPNAILVLLPFAAMVALDTMAWRQLFRLLGRDVHFGQLFRVRFASEAVLNTVAGGVFVSEGVPQMMLSRHGVEKSETFATLGTRKALLVAAQGIYVLLGALLGMAFLSKLSLALFESEFLSVLMLGVGALLFGVGLFLAQLLARGDTAASLFRPIARLLGGRQAYRLARLREGLGRMDQRLSLMTGKRLALPTAVLVAAWVCESLETFTILRLLDVRIEFHEVIAFEPILSLLKHIFFFLPAGVGIQEFGYLTLFKAFSTRDAATLGAVFALLKRGKELCWTLTGLVMLYSGCRSRTTEVTT